MKKRKYIKVRDKRPADVAMRIIAPPLTKMGEAGLDELKTIRADTARLNKQRANSMERWVAKYFGEYGNRVPMSGSAGAWKGDVLVELKNNPGKIVLECKLSAVFNNAKLCPQTLNGVYSCYTIIKHEITML
jgi:hypothetical protein